MPKPFTPAVRSRLCGPHMDSVLAVLRVPVLSGLLVTAFAGPVAGHAAPTSEVRQARPGPGGTVTQDHDDDAERTDGLVVTPATIARPDGVRLSGEVIAPADPPAAALPGMVLVHGSGRASVQGCGPTPKATPARAS